MRKTIYREGIEDLGTFIHNGALTWSEPLPITWQFGYDVKDLLGHAHSIRREDDGNVTARLEFDDNERGRQAAEIVQHKDAVCSIWINEITQKRVKIGRGKARHLRREILNGRIRQIAVVLSGAVPWS